MLTRLTINEIEENGRKKPYRYTAHLLKSTISPYLPAAFSSDFLPDKIEKGIITIIKSDYALKTGAYGIRTSSSLY